MKKGGYAFIEFDNHRDARFAVRKLDGARSLRLTVLLSKKFILHLKNGFTY